MVIPRFFIFFCILYKYFKALLNKKKKLDLKKNIMELETKLNWKQTHEWNNYSVESLLVTITGL